ALLSNQMSHSPVTSCIGSECCMLQAGESGWPIGCSRRPAGVRIRTEMEDTSMSDPRMQPDIRLELEGISRRFGKVTALEDISLCVSPGQVVCLAGQSGCGKSTLLRVIAGIEKPDQGRVILDGREISGPNAFVEPEE